MPTASHLVHLVRHGEVLNPLAVNYAALPGFRLSPLGHRQAAAAGRHLAARAVGAVVSSPLERARLTAAPIAAAHSLDVATDDRLTEWRLSDRWAGTRWSDIAAPELAAYRQHPWDLPFSPESLDDLADRMEAAVLDAAGRHPEGDVVVVAHQDPIQSARLRLTGRLLRDQHVDKPRHASVITLAPGSPWREIEHWWPEAGTTA